MLSQAGLWERAALYGRRSRERLTFWNDVRCTGDASKLPSANVRRHAIGVRFPEGSPAETDRAERIAKQRADRAAARDRAVARKAEREQPPEPDPEREAFERFAKGGKKGPFSDAFNKRTGKLKAGWTLVNGVPNWLPEAA